MEPLELSLTAEPRVWPPAALLILDNRVLEVFQPGHDESARYPVAWLAVHTERKKDRVRLSIGVSFPPEPALYGPKVRFDTTPRMAEVPAADEPQVLAFFTEAARRAGRLAQA